MTNILITGGTGSFGQALVKKLINDPYYDKIIVYSRDEHKQDRMREEINSDKVRYFIGDVRDKDRLKLAMRECWKVVHAAALKIVPTAEYNPMEYVKTNILGSQNLIDIALENFGSTRSIIALSTDKAVNPANLYGATKLTMERLFIASNALTGERKSAVFNVCRYGNVANSNGSVIPVFKRQRDRKEPFTVTDPSMTRFWITLEDAAEFVMKSFGTAFYNQMEHGVSGKIFIPDMPSFRILDLVQAMAFDPMNVDYKVIGIRPGEKIHEQIDHDRFSNTNDKWLSVIDLRERLINMGVI